MVVFCKRCGTPVKLENARLADPTYSAKCQHCQKPVGLDLLRPGAAAPAVAGQAPSSEGTHYLQKIRLFSELPLQECLLLESRLRKREYAPRQVIVKEGGPGDAMFFINSGVVEVRKRDPNTGIDFLLSELKAGACFGEMALLTGKPRIASVVAVETTTCSVLEQAAFDEILLTSVKISLAMSRVLAERLDEVSQHTGVEHINLAKLQFDPRVMRLLPQQMIQAHRVLPLAFGNNRLTLAMVNPNNLLALDDVCRVIKGVIIEPVETSEDDFKRFLTTTYAELMRKEEARQAREQAAAPNSPPADQPARGGTAASKSDSVVSILESLQSEALKSLEVDEGRQSSDQVTDLSQSAEEAPITRLANSILALAIRKGASDIHLEPQEKDLAVRFRIDGALQVVQVIATGVVTSAQGLVIADAWESTKSCA